MYYGGRDLMVLSNKVALTPQQLEKELEVLNEILYGVENLSTFCRVTEIINLNNYKILRKPHHIERALSDMQIKPFIFVSNMN
jgi:hypothetical protein